MSYEWCFHYTSIYVLGCEHSVKHHVPFYIHIDIRAFKNFTKSRNVLPEKSKRNFIRNLIKCDKQLSANIMTQTKLSHQTKLLI